MSKLRHWTRPNLVIDLLSKIVTENLLCIRYSAVNKIVENLYFYGAYIQVEKGKNINRKIIKI